MSTMRKILNEVARYLVMTLASALYAVAISLFLNPLALAPGGVSGISIIINHLTGFPVGTMTLIINTPLMIIAFFKFGRKFFISTAYVLAVSSLFTDVIAKFSENKPILTESPLLAGIAGGTLMAIGMGVIFHAGGMTGGMDIIVRLLRQKYRFINTGTVFFVLDFMVITISAITFKNVEIALYALLSVFISSRVLDFVLYTPDRSKLVYVISESQGQNISDRLTVEMETGVTVFDATGAYTGNAKKVLFCVVKSKSLPRLRRIVRDTDPLAFMTVSDAVEVFGEGYKSFDKEDL